MFVNGSVMFYLFLFNFTIQRRLIVQKKFWFVVQGFIEKNVDNFSHATKDTIILPIKKICDI